MNALDCVTCERFDLPDEVLSWRLCQSVRNAGRSCIIAQSDEPVKPLVGLLWEFTLFSVWDVAHLFVECGSGIGFFEPQAMLVSWTLTQRYRIRVPVH